VQSLEAEHRTTDNASPVVAGARRFAMRSDDRFNAAKFSQAVIIMVVFWTIAVVLWQTTGKIFYLFNFVYLGTAIGVGIGLYLALPRRRKHWGRRLSQLFVGVYMFVFLGLIQQENMQIEGFFFYLLSGFFAGSVIHYLVAKIAGPLLFNRGWCGWACWTAMILDFLPYKRNKAGRFDKKWGYLRYIHFALSLGLVMTIWFGLGYRVNAHGVTALYWLLGGNAFYYAASITLAILLKDNRSFCKYVCPIPALQKISSRFALLKVAGDAEKCDECGACVRVCPMDIRIPEYTKNGQRVLSTECILCLECINICPKGALDTTFGLDVGNRELLKVRKRDEG
jgi:polyferredoxin